MKRIVLIGGVTTVWGTIIFKGSSIGKAENLWHRQRGGFSKNSGKCYLVLLQEVEKIHKEWMPVSTVGGSFPYSTKIVVNYSLNTAMIF